jgi:hypothetical protein
VVQPGLGRLADSRDLPGQHRDARQEHPIAPQPPDRVLEQRHRPVGVRPRPPVEEPRERFAGGLIVGGPVPVPVADLPGVFVGRLRALYVLLHARRIVDTELLGQELHRRPRHVQWILQEAAHRTHPAQLHREAQAMMIRSASCDQIPVGVIEVEQALDVASWQLAGEPAVRRNLLIGQ